MRLKRAQIGEIRLASGQIVRKLHRLRNFAKLCVCRLLLMWISPMQFIPMQLQNPAVQFLHCHPRDIRDSLADCAAPARRAVPAGRAFLTECGGDSLRQARRLQTEAQHAAVRSPFALNQGVLREWAVFVLHTNLLAARMKAEQIRRGEEQQRIGGFSVAPRSA